MGSSLFQTLLRKQDITIYHVVHIYQENPALDVSKRRPLPLTSRGNQEDTYCVENRCVRSPLSICRPASGRSPVRSGGWVFVSSSYRRVPLLQSVARSRGRLSRGRYVRRRGGLRIIRTSLSTLDSRRSSGPHPWCPLSRLSPAVRL